MDPNEFNRRVIEYKSQQGTLARKKFMKKLLFGLALIACMITTFCANSIIANTTSGPTSYPPPSSSEQTLLAQERIESCDFTNSTLWQRRSQEDRIIEMVAGERFSWPEWGIGGNTSSSAIFLPEFIAQVNARGFPMSLLLNHIIDAHRLNTQVVGIAQISGEITQHILSANTNLIELIRSGNLPNARDLAEAPGKVYASHIAVILFYIWIILYGPGTIRDTLISGEERERELQGRAEAYATRTMFSEQLSDQRILIGDIQQQQARDASLQFLQTFVLMNPEQRQMLLTIGRDSGILNEQQVSSFQGALQITNGEQQPEEYLSALGSIQKYPDDKGGRKLKRNKKSRRSKSQKGGNSDFISEDLFFKFISEITDSTLGSYITQYIQSIMDEIEISLNVIYELMSESREFLDKYIESEDSKMDVDMDMNFSYQPGSPRTSTANFSQGYGGGKYRKKYTKRRNKKTKKTKKRNIKRTTKRTTKRNSRKSKSRK